MTNADKREFLEAKGWRWKPDGYIDPMTNLFHRVNEAYRIAKRRGEIND